MQNKSLSIRKITSYLNDEHSDGGGFWLPNIQRPFVWNEDQIARLFDSIMRQYPISTLLIWKNQEPVKHRRFIVDYREDLKISHFCRPVDTKKKLLVLDGQQRLQSLFIGLRGSYDRRELFFDVLSGNREAADVRYRFAFKNARDGVWPWIKFKEIIGVNNKLDIQIAKPIIDSSPLPLSEVQRENIQINVARARQEFVNADNITYQELDAIDEPGTYKVDDIVEVFIRANSGGTKLGKSDLLFSLLTSSWDDADGHIEALLEDLNKSDFEYDRDFVLKSCLVALGKGARYEIRKFRDGSTKEAILEHWDKLAEAIKAVRDWVVSATYIRTGKALPSYQALIPLIFLRYKYPTMFPGAKGMPEYLIRALVTGAFGGSPDNLIDKVVKKIDALKKFDAQEIFDEIRADGRSLAVTPEVILQQGYGSREIHLFFNLWYGAFDYSPALSENGPQIDHIFPQSALKKVKDASPETGRLSLMRYLAPARDQIANCMLLKAGENGFTGKCDTPPEEWFSATRFESVEKQKEYFALHLIPNDPELWKLGRYEGFIEARKKLILEKFRHMLLVAANAGNDLSPPVDEPVCLKA